MGTYRLDVHGSILSKDLSFRSNSVHQVHVISMFKFTLSRHVLLNMERV